MEVDISKGIEVGSFHYEVLQGGEVEKELVSDNAYGKCDNLNRRVKVTAKFSLEELRDTFIHECIEAVNCVYCNGEIKHSSVTNLSHGLAQIFKSLDIHFVYKE